MGTATSKFKDTDWETADGGILSKDQTLDGSDPVQLYEAFTLVRDAKLHTRDFHVVDSKDRLCYKTRKVDGSISWFDVFDKEDKPLFHVQSCSFLADWEILTFDEPVWEGQEANKDASTKSTAGHSLYNKAKVTLNAKRSLATVSLCKDGMENLETVLMVDAMVRLASTKYQSFLPRQVQNDKSLVGFWFWKNTLHNKMELHLAKHTDLLLHVILAIITDLVVQSGGAGTGDYFAGLAAV